MAREIEMMEREEEGAQVLQAVMAERAHRLNANVSLLFLTLLI